MVRADAGESKDDPLLSARVKWAQVLGRTRKVAYILDLPLDSNYRRGTTAFRLIRPVVQQLHRSDADMVWVNFLKDNRHPLVFTEGRAGFPAATHLGDNTFFSMMRKFRGISVKSEMHAFARDPQLAEQLGQVDLPVMFNLALLQ